MYKKPIGLVQKLLFLNKRISRKIAAILLVLLSPCAFADSADDLWQRFLQNSDSKTKTQLLITMGTTGKGNRNIIGNINNYLTRMNSLFVAGNSVDYALVSASITAIMELGDSSSYPVLFNVLCAGYPEVIASESSGAMDLINGDLKQFLSGIIKENPPVEKYIAFKTGINSERLTLSERGQLAELALEISLASDEENSYLNAMRYSSVWTLALLEWTRASDLAVNHYYRVLSDYYRGVVSKTRLIEAITCLGAVGNSDAALVLGLQLGLINAGTESARIFDTEITLAIVQALGHIGAKGAFDHLYYAGNYSYSDNIRIAAKDAINRLKW
jgi:hypothetical protein